MQDGNNGTDDRTPLQTGLESDVTLKLNESLYEVCVWNGNSIRFDLFGFLRNVIIDRVLYLISCIITKVELYQMLWKQRKQLSINR